MWTLFEWGLYFFRLAAAALCVALCTTNDATSGYCSDRRERIWPVREAIAVCRFQFAVVLKAIVDAITETTGTLFK